MGEVVVDTSVLAALVFGEPRSSEARTLLNEDTLYAPTLMGFELAHVAVKKIEAYPQKKNAILVALSLAFGLDIHYVEVDFIAVVKLALDTGLTAYDASFLFLSKSLHIPLATFDDTLRSA